MAKYLYQASYTTQGAKGLLKDGGSRRREAIERMTAALGGSVEAFYYAFGTDDVCLIVDVPDNVTAAAASLAVSAAGAVSIRTTVLLTPEEIDAAAQKTVAYQAPGQ
ncbi:MAG: GYD domain-containing protein [bacterium]|nr:GYD domain-containing protein [bacterium]